MSISLGVYLTEINEEPAEHVVVSCGETLRMGFTDVSDLFTTVTMANGQTATAQWLNQSLGQTDNWYHIAVT